MVDTLSGNVADLVTDAAAKVPGRVALVDTASGRNLTWEQTDRAVDAFAARLLAAGLEEGDRVAIVLPNSAEFCVAVFGILRAGGIAVPAAAKSPELPGLLSDSGARFVVGADLAAPDLAAPDLAAPDLEAAADVRPAMRGGEDIAVICYTSGTAGVPRGVMLSHRALLSNVDQCARLQPTPVTANDRVLLVVPLFHLYGLGPGLLQVAAAGATAVLLEAFGTERALDVCAEHRVTTLVGVPAMYQALSAATPDRLAEGLSTVRLFTSGAAPLAPAVLSAITQATGLPVYEGYGLTETGPVLTSTLVGGIAKPGSVGRPLPGVELLLVDSDGRPVGAPTDPDETEWFDGDETETGRVAARGPNLFSGYWPDGAHGPDEDGWFRTGDVGYLDADGDLRLVDRANDLIIVNGFNVYPKEVERVLDELPQVAESAAVGVPDERTGEQVIAVVVLRDGATLTEDEVRDHCTERLARFKVPSTVRFVDELPHSATGKVRRASLRGSVA
ncbi:AMP-binding protein [Actinophytocola algeriensis]|uniref:Long-chain acyl-CoA synthetase n=1 Tax=Actinophytocola algeriensis TaxID=1768010 RepID=A0A7W7QDY1_9PSEU|nr:AMP-binding protein [Actinophytocola algeriensis]MBB4911827.1 long-chain acyl-CoA synthetase [Actinophytocola algeriensis]MBE1477681.1 long-chain acyl-CoA synthetase [Actinophytocola algeriensis]